MSDDMRKDAQRARAITEGVLLDSQQGAAIAWAYMASYKVDRATILRALTDARRRRASDVAPPPRCEKGGGAVE